MKPHLALIMVQILFGIWPIFGKIVLRSISTSSLVVCRVLGAALAFALLQRWFTPLFKLPKKDFVMLALCSLLGVVGNQLLFVKGLSYSTVINAALLSTTIPVVALLVSTLFGYDRWSAKRLLGIMLAAAGVVYLVNPARAALTADTTLGNVLLVINSFLYGTYIVISKDLFERYGALNVITWIFLLSAVLTAPYGLYSLANENFALVDWTIWMWVVFIILGPTVGAYYLNAWALTRVSPSVVAVYIYLQPLIAFGFAPLILGEEWSSRTVVATVLIFGGVALVTSRSRAARELSEHPDALAR